MSIPKIIKAFTRDPWFRRAAPAIRVHTYALTVVGGRYTKSNPVTTVWKTGFFMHEVNERIIRNYGLGQLAEDGAKIFHSEKALPLDAVDRGTSICEVEIDGVFYRPLAFGDWRRWGHYFYILNLVNKREEHI